MLKALLASTSTLFGEQYLEYLIPTLTNFYPQNPKILFVPFARPAGISYETYTAKFADAVEVIGASVTGLHQCNSHLDFSSFDGVFTGGGNTFLLVDTLYKKGFMEPLKNAVTAGLPYAGCSAGANLGGMSMATTNDMPIILPKDLRTLGLIQANLNPHYLDPIPGNKHNGETREQRIKEFFLTGDLMYKYPVIGLREGNWLEISDKNIWTRGLYQTRIFLNEEQIIEIPTDTEIQEYLK